jgi:3-dehydroquinate synthase class II
MTLDPETLQALIRVEVAAQLAATRGQLPTAGTLGTTEAMALLGYADRKAFLVHARKHGLPYQRLSARKFRWSAAAIHAHQARRTVGKAA